MPARFSLLALLFAWLSTLMTGAADRPPNIVLIYCDDLGYADVGCFGATRIRTPNIDRLAADGIRFTDFYVAQAVCSASRAALMTGCYPNRIGIMGALDHRSTTGLHPDETTMAELLKSVGYATAIVGKWHLGHWPEFLPTRHGFDYWYGLPYSNDMWPFHPQARPGSYPSLPLFENDRAIDPDVTAEDQKRLTTDYGDRVVHLIEQNRDRPFFIYLAHSMPHVPLHVQDRNRGRSQGGLYGDVIEEIDHTVGQVLDTLARLNLDRQTLVIFTSDNGPWLSYGDHGGSTGPLREGKGTAWEGGVRVPFVARWPGRIPGGSVCREPVMTIDLLPTFAKLANARLPERKIDGKDISPLLTGEPGAKSPHEALWFYFGDQLLAVRSGRWKLILPHTYRTLGTQAPPSGGKPIAYQQAKAGLELYDLEQDPAEKTNLAEREPEVVAALQRHVEAARADLGDAITQRAPTGNRQPGRREGQP